MAVYKPDNVLLARQIYSIQQQSVQSWICIVGIDGKDDETRIMLAELTAGDHRFFIHEFHDRVGFYLNFERVLALVESDVDWVALADQDDVWYPDKVEVLLSSLGSASMVLGQARLVVVDESTPEVRSIGKTDRSFFSTSELILDNVVSGALSIFRPGLLKSALPFPRKTDVAYHDHWLGLCAALDGGIVTIPNLVQDYVQHGRNVIGEDLGTSKLARVRTLGQRSRGLKEALRYVVNHRWRWRVYMARLALCRFPQLDVPNREILDVFAVDRSSFGLLKISIDAARGGRSSKSRVISLWMASIFSPAISEEALLEG